jgi:DNA repair protein RecO (recombination protein O)
MNSSRVYTVEGIILKRKSVGEADKILTIFTKQAGKIRVLAKGIRRIHSRRSGHVELFSHVVITLHVHGSLDIVTEAQAMRHGSGFESDGTRMAYAYCMSELVDQLLPDKQEHMDIFMLLTESLDGLLKEKEVERLGSLMSGFIHELLWRLGYLPESRLLPQESMQSYIEQITERKLRTWPLLGVLRDS